MIKSGQNENKNLSVPEVELFLADALLCHEGNQCLATNKKGVAHQEGSVAWSDYLLGFEGTNQPIICLFYNKSFKYNCKQALKLQQFRW